MDEFDVITLDSVDSTNNWAKSHIDNLRDRTIITAESQTSGKGRNGRSWLSDSSENLYLSMLLKPSTTVFIRSITLYTAVVLCKTLENYGVKPKIKWPNDILINDKKTAGILCESTFSGTKLKGIIVGIGVNLGGSQEYFLQIDQPATSLSLELNRPIIKKEFSKNLFKEFFLYYDTFAGKGFGFIETDYVSRAGFLGQEVKINGEFGIAKGITKTGELIFMDENLTERVINSGDMTLC